VIQITDHTHEGAALQINAPQGWTVRINRNN